MTASSTAATARRVLRTALLILPSDVDNYTNCRSVITHALNARSRSAADYGVRREAGARRY